MEIEQYLYDLNDSGEAIVAYTMRSASGNTVQLCNMGAAVLGLTFGGREIATGRCVRGLMGLPAEADRFDERLWESRVETNRVVMALSFEMNKVGVMCEVIFDFDDEDNFEITYQACSQEGDTPFDLTHALSFDLGESATITTKDNERRGTLQSVAQMRGEVAVEMLSSQPTIYRDGEILAPVSSPAEMLREGERYITKSVIRPIQ